MNEKNNNNNINIFVKNKNSKIICKIKICIFKNRTFIFDQIFNLKHVNYTNKIIVYQKYYNNNNFYNAFVTTFEFKIFKIEIHID